MIWTIETEEPNQYGEHCIEVFNEVGYRRYLNIFRSNQFFSMSAIGAFPAPVMIALLSQIQAIINNYNENHAGLVSVDCE